MRSPCGLCWKDRDTGETWCLRLMKWVRVCPMDEREDGHDDEGEEADDGE